MTLLLGPPGSGKITLLLALARKLDSDVKVFGRVTYNGHEMNEFVPQRTAAYISQYDLHIGEMTVRETLSFSARCQGVGTHFGTLALGATKGITKRKALELDLLTADDLESVSLAEDLAKTCFEMYSVTSTGLAPEIAYFNIEGISEYGFDGGNKTSEYINDIIIKPNDRHNLLRPETVESLSTLYHITKDPNCHGFHSSFMTRTGWAVKCSMAIQREPQIRWKHMTRESGQEHMAC